MRSTPLFVALCACMLLPAEASARQNNGQLTVFAPSKDEVTLEKWSDRTGGKLTSSIRRAAGVHHDSIGTGYSRVQFRLNGEGRPEAVSLVGPSRSATVNRVSMKAVKGMGSLLPLPANVAPQSTFEAWIILADNAHQQKDMLTALRDEHRTRMIAQAGGPRPVLIAMR